MGEVYLGVHTRLNRAAAIKVVNLSAMDASSSIRFQNEARLQSNLQHPNIAALYDFKEIGGKLFIFMEYVGGEDLEKLIKDKSFAVEEILKIFYSVVQAVSFVHSNGVIHRDIKLQNIKLAEDGTPKLLDFGIAKDSQSSKLTQTGSLIGTPYYISPEQIAGGKASDLTDVWALGVLLFEMLTSVKPFEAETLIGLCQKIESAQISPIEIYNPSVPPDVSRIVKKCLQKETARRYQTAEALAFETAYVLEKFYGMSVSSPANLASFPQSEIYESGEYEVSNATKKTGGKIKFIVPAAGIVAVSFLILSLLGIWAVSSSGKPDEKAETNQTNKNLTAASNKNSKVAVNGKKIQIDVIESRADVIRDGEVIGKTPYEIVAEEGETIELTLRREGYEDKKIEVKVSSGKKVYTYMLQQK